MFAKLQEIEADKAESQATTILSGETFELDIHYNFCRILSHRSVGLFSVYIKAHYNVTTIQVWDSLQECKVWLPKSSVEGGG